ncbi:MAG: flagellar biosynthesis protein FlgN [Homoserinimonas sp.]|nr:flagellar biosynthesis protein FlgN [Homoserinimonas sp.]
MGANELSASLWRERELLELLMFKLEEEQLLLTAGKSRWLQFATREVEQVMDRLRSAGLARAVEVASLAKEWDAHEDVTLRELVGHAPDGAWAEIFSSHLKAMTEITGQIKELRDSNEQYLRTAIRSTQETMADSGPEVGTYNAKGGSGSTAVAAQYFDRTL